jgi:Ser-tRNA(Ala) deacylase AlaX
LIQTGFSNIESQRRFWKIDGFAEVPCGGTHVKSTAEVGFVSLKRSHPGKGIERIEIKLINENEGITGSYA